MIKQLPMPGLKLSFAVMALMAVLIPLPLAIYNAQLQSTPAGEQISYVSAFTAAAAIKPLVALVVLAIICWLLCKVRMKNPGRWALRVGTFFYWLGAVLGLYVIGTAVYFAVAASSGPTIEPLGRVLSDAIKLVALGACYYFIGRGIRYMLGR